jgi:hypothetical protein
MRLRLIVIPFVVMFFTSACGGGSDWQTYSSTSGNFSILAPGSFKETTQSNDTAIGKIESHTFVLDHGAISYFVSYADFPADAMQVANTDSALEGGVGGALENMNATLVNKIDISLDGAPGKEVQGDIPANETFPNGGVVKARAYLVSNRLYQIYVLVKKGSESDAQMDRYIQSFKLLAPPKAQAPSDQASPTSISTQAAIATKAITTAATATSGAVASPTQAPSPANNPDVGFPLPTHVENVTGSSKDTVNFQTDLTITATMAFYRQAFTAQGLTEWTEATRSTEGTFNLVFRGSSNGKAIVVQGVSLGARTNVNIRYEDI